MSTGSSKKFVGHKQKIKKIVISPDERFLVSASDDQMICVWDIASGKQINCFEGWYPGFSHSGRFFIYMDIMGTHIQEFISRKEIFTYRSNLVSDAAISPDEKYLALGFYETHQVLILDLANAKSINRISVPDKSFRQISRAGLDISNGDRLYVDEQGKLLAVTYLGQEITDPQNRKELQKIVNGFGKNNQNSLYEHTGFVTQVGFNQGCNLVFSISHYHVYGWEVNYHPGLFSQQKPFLRLIDGFERYIKAVSFLPEINRVTVFNEGRHEIYITTFDCSRGNILSELSIPYLFSHIDSFAAHPNGSMFGIGNTSDRVKILDTKGTILFHDNAVSTAMTFSKHYFSYGLFGDNPAIILKSL